MTQGEFYTPEEIRPLYGEVVPAYQSAFAGPPWNEVSKCIDAQKRCAGGLSTTALGQLCNTCSLYPTKPAYESDELIKRFDSLAATRATSWYTERNNDGLTLAAVGWKATPSRIVDERYPDVPEMNNWAGNLLSDSPIVWLDEIFANRQIKSTGNLRNFGNIIAGLAKRLGCETVAYRTIAPQMITVANRDFRSQATIFAGERVRDDVFTIPVVGNVPDRRDFIIIDTGMEQ